MERVGPSQLEGDESCGDYNGDHFWNKWQHETEAWNMEPSNLLFLSQGQNFVTQAANFCDHLPSLF
jgi:hypothetical protein